MERGYIKVYRKILDTGIIQNPHALQLFCYLLLTAAYKPISRDVRGEMIKLEPGQVIFGRQKVAETLNISEKNVRTALKYLEKNEIVAIRPTKRYTIISIINWNTYQNNYNDMGHQSGHEPAMSGPSSGHEPAMSGPSSGHEPAMSGPSSGHEPAMSGPSSGHEPATVKELKNINNNNNLKIEEDKKGEEINNQNTGQASLPVVVSDIKKSKKKKTGDTFPEMKEAIEAYTENQELREALLGWLKMRYSVPGKKPTGHAVDLSLKELDKLALNETEKIKIVNQSIVRNWTAFFELKKESQAIGAKVNSGYNSADKTAYVMEQNRQTAQRWLKRELQKQGEQNGSGNE